MMPVNFYYSDELTQDTEGNLVQLCDDCAKSNADKIEWAAQGDTESMCELCDANNNPEWYAQFSDPACVECGGPLTESDIEAGEDVCLDCAAAIALESDIDHEPGSLLATVRVRLEGGG